MKTFSALSHLFIVAAALALASLAVAAPRAEQGDGKASVAVHESSGSDGARLWVATCNRCHNARPPKTYSDAQWGVVLQHMRTRAYLTGAEARAVLAYLQETN